MLLQLLILLSFSLPAFWTPSSVEPLDPYLDLHRDGRLGFAWRASDCWCLSFSFNKSMNSRSLDMAYSSDEPLMANPKASTPIIETEFLLKLSHAPFPTSHTIRNCSSPWIRPQMPTRLINLCVASAVLIGHIWKSASEIYIASTPAICTRSGMFLYDPRLALIRTFDELLLFFNHYHNIACSN